MDDDTSILLFLGIGLVVLILIIVFGVLSSRRKNRATAPTFSVRQRSIGPQPFLESSDFAGDDKRQEELFRQAYPIGSAHTIAYDADGQRVERTVHVARIGRGLRGGWPQAKFGMTVYFREWENTDFPATFAVQSSDKVASVTVDAEGLTAMDPTGAPVWTSPWSALVFSNGNDIIVANGSGKNVRFETRDPQPELEEIILKYGTFKQLHF